MTNQKQFNYRDTQHYYKVIQTTTGRLKMATKIHNNYKETQNDYKWRHRDHKETEKWRQMETNWAQREPAASFVIVLYLFMSLSVWVSCYCTWEEWGAFHMSVPRGPLSHNPSMHVCLSMPALRVCVCSKQVEYSEALHIYECVSINTEGQMSLAGFFHWNTSPEKRPVWQSLPSLPPPGAGTKRHLSCSDGEEKSQHFVQRAPRSGFTKSLTGGAARCFYA